MNNIRVRAIIPLEEGIVFIHRIRTVDNVIKEYYPLPGGGVENGETIEVGLHREIMEELGLEIEIVKPIYKIIDDISIQYFYLCKYVSGIFGTGNGPEFNSEQYQEKGKYIPEIISIKDLDKVNIVPQEFKAQLLEDLRNNSLENIEYKEITVLNTNVL